MKISRNNMEALITELIKLRAQAETLRSDAQAWYDDVDRFDYDKRDAEWSRYQISKKRDKLEKELDEFTEYIAKFFDFLFGETRSVAIASGKNAESVQSSSNDGN